MNLTRAAIDYHRLTLVAVVCIVIAGIQTYLSMPRAYDPGYIIRAAQITSYFPGASPERVEQLISAKIEDVVKEIPELDFVSSESRTGISIITVNISESYREMRPVWDKLRRKVDNIRSDLPADVLGPYVNDEFGDVFGIVFTITGEGFNFAEVKEIADEVQDRLQRLPDTAKVEIHGAQKERIFIEFDNARLSELGVSPNQLAQALAARNIVVPGGSVQLGNERIALEPSGNFETVGDIRKTILRLSGNNTLIYLEDIATIKRDYVDPPSSLIHSSGEPALAIAVSMRTGGNNIELGEQIRAQLRQFRQEYPYGIEFDLVHFSPAEVDHKISNFASSLLQAIGVVTLVMLLSLGLRTGLIVASLIPLAMLMSLIVMQQFDIGLDQVSLAALIIALGMLVDNGIVMSESILVQMEQGRKALDAAIESAAELRMPLLTASLTTVSAFLPIYLAESNVGEFTASIFKVVAITLLCSWLIALTVIPLLSVRFLRVKKRTTEKSRLLQQWYRNSLTTLLRFRYLTLAITLLVFVVAMTGFGYVTKLFFPPSDRLYFKVELELPTGTDITTTKAVVADLEHFLKQKPQQQGIRNWISYIGNAGPKFILSHNPKPSDAAYALMIVNVDALENIDPLRHSIADYARNRHPDLTLKTRRIENGPAIDNPVEVRLSGQNSKRLFAAVAELRQQLSSMDGIQNISDNWGQRIKKLDIRINQARALRAGVSSQDIAVSLQAGISGLELTEYREGEDTIPVLLRSSVANQNDIGKVESLSVYVQSSGQSVPLKQVADISVVWEAARIYRRDGVRTVTVGAQLKPGANAAEQFALLQPWLHERVQAWQGIRYEFGGENESSGKANQSIIDKLGIAALAILLLLVAQFNSVRKPFIVVATIPLALIGVVIGLLLGESFFGFMTFLGIISLAGIVINNAIVLLERIQIELEHGKSQHQAVIEAALQRARPILLTTATTVLGLLPLYLGGGEMWQPMALSIMTGLLFATVLTLAIVPVLYACLYRVQPE